MNGLELISVYCPYCGESIDVTIDCSLGTQEYIEDCQVCCRPITLQITVDEQGQPYATPKHEDE